MKWFERFALSLQTQELGVSLLGVSGKHPFALLVFDL